MAVKIRKAKLSHECTSCQSNGGKMYEVGFGKANHMTLVCLCDTCMHSLLQKLIIVGSKQNEVQ